MRKNKGIESVQKEFSFPASPTWPQLNSESLEIDGLRLKS